MAQAPRNFLLMSAHARLIKAAVAYNIIVFFVFFAIYSMMDFSKHFTRDASVQGKLYYATLVHTQGGPNDIVPTTDVARVVQALHVGLAWAQLLLVFLG